MEELPPIGWGDVATKADLSATENNLNLRLDALEHRVPAQVRLEINRMIMWFVPTMLSGVGLALAAARLS
jgi:hypothetical protein